MADALGWVGVRQCTGAGLVVSDVEDRHDECTSPHWAHTSNLDATSHMLLMKLKVTLISQSQLKIQFLGHTGRTDHAY